MSDVIEVVLVKGEIRCIYLNDYRIVGSKAYHSESQETRRYEVPIGKIREKLKRKPRQPK